MRLVIGLIVSLSYVQLAALTKFRSDVFPSKIPTFEVRKDETTQKPVVSGLLHSLPLKSTLENFRKHLQCSTKDSNLNYNNGIISKFRMAPFTSETLKSFCASVERVCDSWVDCITKVPTYEQGDYKHKDTFNRFGAWSSAELLRVLNGTLHNDWPWGTERVHKACSSNPLAPLLNLTLGRISDMRDSAFFTGGADPVIRGEVQIPYLAECTHEIYADSIFPWVNIWMVSLGDYKRQREKKVNFTEEGYNQFEPEYKDWDTKVAKAALFISFQPHRTILMDVARQRPDLIDCLASEGRYDQCIESWNPASTEVCDDKWVKQLPSKEELEEYNKLPPGYGLGLYNVSAPNFVHYHPGSYKYVVVPLGRQTKISTSARIVHVLFYSGAVVLAPRTEWKFHFQAQFIPWVHYVPISYSGGDLAEKVEWLKEHDDLAQRIAENGRNFARSYLRLEDLYCYAANTMDVMAELSVHTDAASNYNDPKPVPYFCLGERDFKEWYSWPV